MNRPRAGAPDRTAGGAVPGLAARQGAARILAAVLERGQLPEAASLAGAPPERAEARGLADLAFRRLIEIDRVLAGLVPKAPRAPALDVLRVMAAELLFGAGAAHAAVDLAVRQIKAGPADRLAGLVNAVGRRLAAEGPALLAQMRAEAAREEGIAADDPRLPARLGMAGWLRARLLADWGEARTDAIACAHLALPPTDLTLRAAGDAGPLAAELGGRILPTGTLRLDARPQISALPGFAAGAWWVQDAAAALPAGLVGALPGMRVLDLCAAPGGKTLQLAAAGATVTALDISGSRLGRLCDNLARTGLAAAIVEADALAWEPAAPFDAILLDAPCSATGTVRRHPDLPHRVGPGDLPALVALQARLLERAAAWLAPGGRLVYATCSLLRAEGEDQAARLPGRTGLAPEPVQGPFATAEGHLRTFPDLWPERGGLDGFFAARFRRPA